jgi:hypothetical protein
MFKIFPGQYAVKETTARQLAKSEKRTNLASIPPKPNFI